MRKRPTWAGKLLRSHVLLPLLAGCAGQTETPLPATTKVLDELPRVQNSTKAPCWMQEQVAAQNSYIDTIKAKRETVYQAPCKVDKPKIAEAKR